MKKRILVFGAGGRLGRTLINRLYEDKHNVIGFTRNEADLREPQRAIHAILQIRPDIVINASAYNGLENCLADPWQAFQVNAASVVAMADTARKIESLFIHYSTDYVFGGDNPNGYTEDSEPKPWGVYGHTKRIGEQGALFCGGRVFVFRLSSIYGPDLAGVLQPVKQVQSGCGAPNNPVKVLRQSCAPTSTRLIAEAIAHIVNKVPEKTWPELRGIYHLATCCPVWKTDFTRILLDKVYGPRIANSELQREWSVVVGELAAPRPVHSVLKTDKFQETFKFTLPAWPDDLDATLPLLALPPRPATLVPQQAAN